MLPFDRETYRNKLESDSDRTQFDDLLLKSRAVLELPGRASEEQAAYVMAGRATIAHCDVLIAVWDGQPARGRGGTADVVTRALTRGTAVIYLQPSGNDGGRILWSGFDPQVLTMGEEEGVSRPLTLENLRSVVASLTQFPEDKDERDFGRRFFEERSRRFRLRVEYPLMLALAGVRPFGVGDIRDTLCEAQIRSEWQGHRRECADAHQLAPPGELLENAYCWADRLATHFAQTYRSGHIFGFLLGGVAVCLGLSAFMAPTFKLALAAIEMVITFAIIANAMIGTRNEWHRRWLDYRQLAERLRPMRSLHLLGIAAPDPPGTAVNPVPRRWIEWYSAALWRAIGCPTGKIDEGSAACLAVAIGDREVAPQVEYHQSNADRIDKLDGRLEAASLTLFLITLLVSFATVVGYALNLNFVDNYGDWFTLISAGFPALGTALFGIRFQGDFGGDALRSQATAMRLNAIDLELRRNVTLTRAADLSEQAARIMLADLDEWRLVNQQRELEMG